MRFLNRSRGELCHRLVKRSFPIWQRLGLHVTYNHFYEPVPDARTILEEFWSRRSELPGIDMNDAGQVEMLSLFVSSYRDEYGSLPEYPTGNPTDYHIANGLFESVDGEMLYCMIRHLRPRRMIEIGCGFSTLLALRAISENAKFRDSDSCAFTAIEPYPDPRVRSFVPKHGRLLEQPVERVPLAEFESLSTNDILFIDSSHVLKTGSDVQYEYLEVLPRLHPGVVVHIHDIFLPMEYPKEWILSRRDFWTEQYLLQAFLTFNDRFKVLWGGYYMHLTHPEKLEAAFPTYHRGTTRPGSFWMRRVD